MLTTLLLFALGLVTGVLGGFLGIGGGLLITVVVLEMFKHQGIAPEIRYQLAFGTTIVGIIGTALSSAIAYHRMGRVLWKVVWVVGSAALVFSFIGSKLAAISSSDALRMAFIAFCFITAALIVWRLPTPRDDHDYSRAKLVVIGCGAGLLSAYLGLAGGAVMVPAMILWAHIPTEFAPGTSNAVGVITCVFGAIGYAIHGAHLENLPAGSWGFIVPAFAIPLFFGTLTGGPIGSAINRKYGKASFRYAFAVFLLVVAVKMVLWP